MKIFTLLLMITLIFTSSLAKADNKQTWIKLTCFGPTVPYVQNYPQTLKFSDLLDAYFLQTSKYGLIATLEDLRDQNMDRFAMINDRCHTQRIRKMDLSNFPKSRVWLDWNTDYQYAGFKISIATSPVGICQKLHGPCLSTINCCKSSSGKLGSKFQNPYCDPVTKSCEYYQDVVKADPVKSDGN